ncbi:ParB/RepB/Spo0J family partition protein [bacterium]|nr:ParB/RepB/Spo0J family partition protein [candidate division CSSED10-310 bacterium]
MKRKTLGKGLSALIQNRTGETTDKIHQLPITRISPAKHQPRRLFSDDTLKELSESIKSQGIILPVIVRPAGIDYELIAGERRFRAAKLAGLNTIPALIKSVSDHDALEIALIENLQRDDLTPIEMASGYKMLMEEHGLKQEEIGRIVGKDRSTITNTLRILTLPDDIKEFLQSRELSIGHAKALLSLPSDTLKRQFAIYTLKNNLSVRMLEKKIKLFLETSSKHKPDPSATDPILEAALDRIRQKLATKIVLKRKRSGGGTLVLTFFSEDDLIRLLENLGVSERG